MVRRRTAMDRCCDWEDEKPFIGEMFQLVAVAHQKLKSMSDLSTVTE
jgi:hypothetical protein